MPATTRLLLSVYALLAIVGGLLYGVSRPDGAPTVVQLRGAASVVGLLVAIAAGSGIAAMATVQFWKVLFLPRSSFHYRELRLLFGSEAVDLLTLASADSRNPWGEFKGRTLTSLLDNPTEVVVGQLRSAADYILIRPEQYKSTLLKLAGSRGAPAVDNYLAVRSERLSRPSDGREVDAGLVNDALVEVRFFVDQRLTMAHVSLKERWKRQVRMISAAVAGTSGVVVAGMSNLSTGPKVSAVFAAIVWGGFFSWLARDFVALVERRRA